jgi:predicted metal-binding membrane protein
MLDQLAPSRTRYAVVATLAVAAACWVVAVGRMDGMDMGPATGLGSLAFFISTWVVMMAAMMLPGAVRAVARRARSGAVVAASFVVEYLAVWTIVGLATFALYEPHSTAAAGSIVLAAGAYELTPIKRYFRERCQRGDRSGLGYGICCVGSSIGLMLVLLALGVMNIAWTAVIAALVLFQKLVPPRTVVDVSVGLAIAGFGVLILAAPSSVPGLM